MVDEVEVYGSARETGGRPPLPSEEAASSSPVVPSDDSRPGAESMGQGIPERGGDPDLVARILSRFAVAAGPEVDGAIATALQEMAQDAGLEHAYVVLRDGAGLSFSMEYEWCAPGAKSQREDMQNVPMDRYPWFSPILLAGRSVQIDSREQYPQEAQAERESNAAFGTRSLLLLPLRGRGNLVNGAIGLEAIHREHQWTDADVRRVRVIGDVLVNVLERKQVEQELRASEAQLLALTQLIPDIVSVIDESGRLVFNSSAAKRIHGYDAEDLVGKNTMDNWHPDDVPVLTATFERLKANPGSIEKAQYRYRNKDGTYQWMEVVASNQLEHPVIRGIVSLSRDISDRKREEEERRRLDLKVQQLQNIESLGVLAGGVAHDFNNLLVAILGNIDLTLATLPPDSPAREGLAEASKASMRAADLARQMLAYAGKGRVVLEAVDLGELVDEMAHMLQASISRRASLQVHRSMPLPLIEVDPSQVRQIILNLILNATEAIGPGGGTISITTTARHCDRDYLAQTWLGEPLGEGQYVLLEISDTGCGMDGDTVARIFDPFFSTKFTGRGLGLAAVLGIIRSHKGAIRVSSEPERGTTFGILFPVGSQLAAVVPVVSTPTPTRPAERIVLLVDDEDLVRQVGTRMLEYLGCTVLEATNGEQALALLAQHGPDSQQGAIGLVILDLTMPVLDGRETFTRLRRVWRDLPVIIASGYAESDVMLRFAGADRLSFIQKPFVLEQLGALLDRVLDPTGTQASNR